MSRTLLSFLDRWESRRDAERDMAKRLSVTDAPPLTDITFAKQSHNAMVFRATCAGENVYLKSYETDHGSVLVRDTVEETSVVQSQMTGRVGGVVDVIWASEDDRMVLMSEALGRPVADVLSDGEGAQMMKTLADWLREYVGPRYGRDRFITGYWLKQRSATDLSGLSAQDRDLAGQLLARQTTRQAALGNVPVYKARLPKDFAPHNLHWTGSQIWGFDIEGYSRQPVGRVIAMFCILAEKRLPVGPLNATGLQDVCQTALQGAFAGFEDPPEVFDYFVGDLLFHRLARRHDDRAIAPRLRQMIAAHLERAS